MRTLPVDACVVYMHTYLVSSLTNFLRDLTSDVVVFTTT